MPAYIDESLIITTLQIDLSNLLSVYLFGSHAQGNSGPDSDLDLAVLLAGRAEPLRL